MSIPQPLTVEERVDQIDRDYYGVNRGKDRDIGDRRRIEIMWKGGALLLFLAGFGTRELLTIFWQRIFGT